MFLSRRSLLAAGAGGAISTTVPAAARSKKISKLDVTEAARLSETANAALMRGDIDKYSELITFSDDFTFMSPFGGQPTYRDAFTPERVKAMGAFFKNGTFRQELVEAYSSGDLVVLVLMEHQNVEVGGLPAQEWPLRVTLVYRRVGSGWQLAHRHADPLSDGLSVERAAALARGA